MDSPTILIDGVKATCVKGDENGLHYTCEDGTELIVKPSYANYQAHKAEALDSVIHKILKSTM